MTTTHKFPSQAARQQPPPPPPYPQDLSLRNKQGWKLMRLSHCQELGQQASLLLIGYTRVNNIQSDARSESWPNSLPWLQLINFRCSWARTRVGPRTSWTGSLDVLYCDSRILTSLPYYTLNSAVSCLGKSNIWTRNKYYRYDLPTTWWTVHSMILHFHFSDFLNSANVSFNVNLQTTVDPNKNWSIKQPCYRTLDPQSTCILYTRCTVLYRCTIRTLETTILQGNTLQPRQKKQSFPVQSCLHDSTTNQWPVLQIPPSK